MRITISIVLFIAVALSPFWVHAQSARSLVASGNEFYASGDYDKALEAYEKATAEEPQAGEVFFNKGNAYFQKGEYDKAREAYQAAALNTKDLPLEAAAHYNLGNTVFAEGQKQLETDPQKTLAQYGDSIRHYQEALRADPGLREAAQNIEVVRLSMKDLADKLKKAEDAAKEQREKREQIQKQLDEAIKEQESEIKENQSLQEKASEDSRDSMDGKAQRLADDQEKTRDKTREIADKLKELEGQQQQGQTPQQQPDIAPPSTRDHLESAQEAQKSAVEKLRSDNLSEARKDQEEALARLKDALNSAEDAKKNQGQCPNPQTGDQGGKEQGGEKQQEQSGAEDQPAGDKKDKAKEAQQQPPESQAAEPGQRGEAPKGDEQKMGGVLSESPENILREEKENRLQLYRAPKGGHKPVDKDW
jgi:Ca-activated chloride channel homolog